jgi:hypothetical protein
VQFPNNFANAEELTLDEGATNAAAAPSPPLSIVVPEQDHEKWCWAAVCTGVIAFYAQIDLFDQCRTASQIFNTDCCLNPSGCDSATFLDIALDHLHHFGNPSPDFDFTILDQEINQLGHPVCALIDFGSNVGHFVVIKQCYTGDDGVQYVGVVDPAPGRDHDAPEICTYDGFTVNYHGGRCDRAFRTV